MVYYYPGERGTTYDGLYGEALHEKCTIFRLQVYERVGMSRVEAYESIGNLPFIKYLKGL